MAEGPSSNCTDLVDAIREVLRHSDEPLTIPKIRARLAAQYRSISAEELTETLNRQVAAHVLVICPKYRSSQDRYWDRPLREHAKVTLRNALADGPTTWSEVRKAFPKYLRHLADSVLNEELARGAIHRHPPATVRQGPRYALHAADARRYVHGELQSLLSRIVELGFSRPEAREAIVQLLQDEEWTENEIAGVGTLRAAVNTP
ncbi:MAG TPA: hypothetical protein VFE62_27985 [Gemmataceae bacterium]|nr:hypothetical protein [Gemmataceae bacterium]